MDLLRSRGARALAFALALTSHACFEEDPGLSDAGPADAGAPGPAAARVDYESAELYAAPWPDERLRREDGTVSVAGFPNPRSVRITGQLTELLDGAAGFPTSATLFFAMTGALDPSSLPPSPASSLEPAASVYLVDVDPSSPEVGARTPVVAEFAADPGPFGAPNLLAILPLQGRPLAAGRLYAAVVTTDVRALDGSALEAAAATREILDGQRPAGLGEAAFAAHTVAATALSGDADRIAAMAVFRTWDPILELAAARAQVLEDAAPALEAAPEAREVFDDYCVFRATVRMPDFQGGVAPYESEGGGWVRDASGRLVVQRDAESAVWFTVPRRAMPAAGFPSAVFVRTGGGGDRPLVDRGVHGADGMTLVAGSGPASWFARAGVVGVSVDGPLGGLRNPTGWDEQFAIFNINNPVALRDSIRQSALELALFAHTLEAVSFDASSCAGLTTPAGDGVITLDLSSLAIMGHSMGATIAPLVVALEPRYRALILSGAGASWIANVIHKESPLRVRPAAEALLTYSAQGRTITEHDPVLALLQWAGEPADPQVYARHVIAEPIEGAPRHVLMFQGILDTYIPPPIANPLSLALGLDLGGAALDETLSGYPPLSPLLPLAGAARVDLPARGNRSAGASTGLVVQHVEDGLEDGHEVVFQTAPPQRQTQCFLQSLRDTPPTVIASDAICE